MGHQKARAILLPAGEKVDGAKRRPEEGAATTE